MEDSLDRTPTLPEHSREIENYSDYSGAGGAQIISSVENEEAAKRIPGIADRVIKRDIANRFEDDRKEISHSDKRDPLPNIDVT